MKIAAYAVKKSGGKAEPFSYERKIGKNDVLIKTSYLRHYNRRYSDD